MNDLKNLIIAKTTIQMVGVVALILIAMAINLAGIIATITAITVIMAIV